MTQSTRIHDVRHERFYRAGEPFVGGGVQHLTRYRDVEEAFALEKRGLLTCDLSFIRQYLATVGVQMPERVHISSLFLWLHGDVKADGSPGRHPVLHKLLAKYFTKTSVADVAEPVRQYARELLRENVAQNRRTFDLVDFGQKLSFRGTSVLLDLPYAAERFMRQHIEERARRSDLNALDPEEPEVRTFFQDLFDAERRQPKSAFLRDLAAAEIAGTITRDERDALVWGCWGDGSGTTAAAIPLMIGLLVESGSMDEVRQHLTDQPWLDNVVNEALRYGTPFVLVPKIGITDVELTSGVVIRKGEQVQLVLSAANRDPAVFGDDADEFKPGRLTASRHLTFGRGVHWCIGAGLASLQMRVALQEIARHLPGLRIVGWKRESGVVDNVLTADFSYDLDRARSRVFHRRHGPPGQEGGADQSGLLIGRSSR